MIRYLGTHHPNWLATSEVPLFISRNRLKDRKSFPRAACRWALDSGGFTEIQRHGRWTITAEEYVAEVRRYAEAIGPPDWAAPQDWMCEPAMLERTGLTVAEHQRRTVENYLELRRLAPEIRFIPVLQGQSLDDYQCCAAMYAAAGVDLADAPVVGLGSVCRRQATDEIREIVEHFAGQGLRLHGFGVKVRGLSEYGHLLTSVDSMAWSFHARRRPPLPGHTHKNCANCPEYAYAWYRRQAHFNREVA